MVKDENTNWRQVLNSLIKENNHLRIDGKPASFKTQEERAKYLFKFFEDLRGLGYAVSPPNIKQKHINVICQKYEEDAIAASTIQTYISFLRAFCQWIGKHGMIGDVSDYFSNPDVLFRQYAATKDKSWDKPEIDKYAILGVIQMESPYVYTQLLLADAFGLRRKETVMFKPHMCDKTAYILILQGAKGGRIRDIPIEDEYQVQVLNIAKALAKYKHASVGDPLLSLKQNLAKFSNTMTKFGIKKTGKGALGITAHGLRSGYAHRQLEQHGFIPSVKNKEGVYDKR